MVADYGGYEANLFDGRSVWRFGRNQVGVGLTLWARENSTAEKKG